MNLFSFSGGELDYQTEIVRLDPCLVRRLATAYRSAFYAFVGDYISALRVGLGKDRLHIPSALAGAVAGVFIEMPRPKAEWTMVSRGVAKRLHRPTAMRADKSAVIFRKSLALHIKHLTIFLRAASALYYFTIKFAG